MNTDDVPQKTMPRRKLIHFWKVQLNDAILLSPSMKYIIEQTVKALEEKDGKAPNPA